EYTENAEKDREAISVFSVYSVVCLRRATMTPEAFATSCHVGPEFVPCDPAELAPLLEFLERGEQPAGRVSFPRGTLLPGGRLDLCKQGIGPEGARAVTAALPRNAQVVHILFGADGIGDPGAEAVAGLARANPGLRTVYLGCNYITAEGAK